MSIAHQKAIYYQYMDWVIRDKEEMITGHQKAIYCQYIDWVILDL